MAKKYHKPSYQELTRIVIKLLASLKTPSKKIQKVTMVSERTIFRVKKRRAQRKEGSGRPKILTASEKIRIQNFIKKNPYISLQNIVDGLRLSCSKESIRRYLHKSGFVWKKASKKEVLSPDDMWMRTFWALDNLRKPLWEYVIYSDESGFLLHDTAGYAWQKKNQEVPQLEEVQERYCHKINVWVAISVFGKMGIHIYKENLNQQVYNNILSTTLIPNIKKHYPYGAILQHDNHPVHKGSEVIKYLNSRRVSNIIVNILDWPARSPDLNPVENVWAAMKNSIRRRYPKTMHQLEQMIYEEWKNLSDEWLGKLCVSVPLRAYACFEKGGQKLKY